MDMRGLVLVMGMCGVACAQTGANALALGLRGKVMDAQDNGLQGVKAELLDCFTGQVTKIVIADDAGNFTLTPDAQSPSYCLRFSGSGFRAMELNVDWRDRRVLQVRVPVMAGKAHAGDLKATDLKAE